MNSTISNLNSTMLGRCVLSHAAGFDEAGHDPDQWPDMLKVCMAMVFEHLVGEITVLLETQPDLTAHLFALMLLEESKIEQEDNEWPTEIEEEPCKCEWHNHPSLTAEQRNHR